MKSRTLVTLGISLLVPAAIVSTVAAQEQTTTTKPQVAQTTTVPTEAQKKAMQDRIQQRKDAQKLKLTTAQQKRLKDRCKNAQGKIVSEQAKTNGIETSRTKIYTDTVSRLTTLETKLAAQGLDTAALKTAITTLKTQIATFNTDLAAYKDAVSDLAAMDCTADPTGFKASLEATRTARKKVREDANAIRAYNKDTIKPTLAALRAQLAAKPAAEGAN